MILILAPNAFKADVNVYSNIDEKICLSDRMFCPPINNISNGISRKRKMVKSSFSYKNSEEYRILIQTFSSGATLKELCSIAIILTRINPEIKEPCRDAKRNFPLLMEWYHYNWCLIYPILPFIQLRDENMNVINGERELLEMHTNSSLKYKDC